ncbi:hypothetical protein H2204_003020 [Knufia peltigerae]|uniref:Zn(2)-C6 fungal-type domain-containing protein n=1 Tax=Knufia peltigerae TaxID=1002370 RepID=A0AA39D1X3_9EURO|nr:hypothetical protein H2204_003020 [Knufia peltigerae]
MDGGFGRTRKAERACRPCRDLKVRCRPCSERDDICQKCKRSGARCVFEEVKRRRKRESGPDVPGSAPALRTKGRGLTTQLDLGVCDEKQGGKADPHSFLPSPGHDEDFLARGMDDLLATTPDYSRFFKNVHSLDQADVVGAASEPSTTVSNSCNDNIANAERKTIPGLERFCWSGELAHDAAATALCTYRERMTRHFPFVPIPGNVTVQELAITYPATLHAIIVVTSSGEDDKQLQKRLEKSFRDQILRSVMIDGERNTDLLQALIIYLAWYHFFYIPMKQQFYQTLQIAISICIDMKFDRPPEEDAVSPRGVERDTGLMNQPTRDDHAVGGCQYHSRSAVRAYVGCFCLSTITSWIWCKPSTLQCTSYLIQCARSLSDREPEYPTDTMILPLVEAMVLGNERHHAYLAPTFDHSSQSSLGHVEASLATLQDKIATHRPLVVGTSEYVSIDLVSSWAVSFGHEMKLLNPCNPPPPASVNAEEQRITLTPSRNRCLMICLQTSSKVFETFLSLSLEEYSGLSVLQWWALICNTAYLYRLCLGIPELPEWEVRAARDATKLEIYLDLLCYRLERATGSTLEGPIGRDLHALLCPIFTNVKRSYERLNKLPRSSGANNSRRDVHVHLFYQEGQEKKEKPPHQKNSATHRSRCPAFRYISQAEELSFDPAHDDNDVNILADGETDLDMFLNSSLFEGINNTWDEDMSAFHL